MGSPSSPKTCSIMSRNTFYLICILALLALNLFIIGRFFWGAPPKHPEPRFEIIERLGLDEEQIVQYDSLIRQHRRDIRNREKEQRMLRTALYAALQSEVKANPSDSLLHALVQVQQEIELIHFNHFRDLRAVCKPEQEPAYQDLLQDLSEIFSPKPPRRH